MPMMSMPMASIPMPLVPLPATVGVPWPRTAQDSVATMTWVPTRVRLIPMAIPFSPDTSMHVSPSWTHNLPGGTSPESCWGI